MSEKLEVDCQVFDGSRSDHIEAAEQIAEWSEQSQSMIPLTLQAVNSHQIGVLATSAETGQLAGYAGITVQYNEEVVEFGGLVASPNIRRRGVAQSLTEHVLSIVTIVNPAVRQVIAFGNPQSSKLFEKLGCVPLGVFERQALSGDVWKLCKNCPTRPGIGAVKESGCCNRVYDLTPCIAILGQR